VKCYVGIDLGSTTTKAVLLDETGAVLGRGITNSRSNYDVACQVARNEAFMDARMHLFEERLDRRADLSARKDKLLGAVRRGYRLEQHLHQLVDLEGACRMEAERTAERSGADKGELGRVLDDIFAGLRSDADELFGENSKSRSDFFRDIAGSGYMGLAERICREYPSVDYETLLGIYDKSILLVEGHAPDARLHEVMSNALGRAVRQDPLPAGQRRLLEQDVDEVLGSTLTEAASVGTGYGRARLPFPKECIRSEILCHGLGAHATFPDTRTVLDIGGQDTKAIQVNDQGIVTSFQMNDRCAAGCGRYLGYIADEMNLGLHQLGPMAMKGKRPVRINSTCTVFAGAELRDRLAMGQRREDILAGLHRSIMLRAMSLLARSGGVHEQFTFTGGVANNEAAVSALLQLVEENYGERTLNISPSSIYTGALGAAIFARRDALGEADPTLQSAVAGGAA
jgi:benzoyl-CoA reductase subunit A